MRARKQEKGQSHPESGSAAGGADDVPHRRRSLKKFGVRCEQSRIRDPASFEPFGPSLGKRLAASFAMRYQIRMMDQNLPGLVRELASACWKSAAQGIEPPGDMALYRALYRGLRNLLKAKVQANRYCGGALSCERGLHPGGTAPILAHEAYPGEHVHIYLLEPDYGPELLMEDLVNSAVQATQKRRSRQSPEDLSKLFRYAVTATLRNRIFESSPCGQSPLCGMNEPYDPWDLRDPVSRLVPAGSS